MVMMSAGMGYDFADCDGNHGKIQAGPSPIHVAWFESTRQLV
jgi:hypothetical protein